MHIHYTEHYALVLSELVSGGKETMVPELSLRHTISSLLTYCRYLDRGHTSTITITITISFTQSELQF